MKYQENVNAHGFKVIYFNDYDGEKCNIQKSSHIGDDCIWIGTDSANPQILASKTKQGGNGWVKYEIPRDVLISHRMHLSKRQCVSLGIKLLKFGLFGKL